MRILKSVLIVSILFLAACGRAADEKQTANAIVDSSGCSDSTKACEPEPNDGVSKITDFEEISVDDAISIFKNRKDGMILFGFDSCPWCIEAEPVLLEESIAQDVPIYYVRTRDADRNLIYTPEQKEEFTPYLQDYMKDNDEGVLTLFVPLLVTVKDGYAVDGHMGTVDGHDAKERKMTEEEVLELKNIYKKMLENYKSA